MRIGVGISLMLLGVVLLFVLLFGPTLFKPMLTLLDPLVCPGDPVLTSEPLTYRPIDGDGDAIEVHYFCQDSERNSTEVTGFFFIAALLLGGLLDFIGLGLTLAHVKARQNSMAQIA